MKTTITRILLIAMFQFVFVHAWAQFNAAKLEIPIDPVDLIGYTVIGSEYPDGWSAIASTTHVKHPYELVTIKKDKKFALAMIKKNQNNIELYKKGFISKEAATGGIITSAITVLNPSPSAHICYFGKDRNARSKQDPIYADVSFKRRCDLETTLIHKAWRQNTKTGLLQALTDTHGLTCEFEYVRDGEPEPRKGCPNYAPFFFKQHVKVTTKFIYE